jgi:hypothetical protein
MNKNRSAIELILTLLQHQAEFSADLLDDFLCTYHESYKKMRGKLSGSIKPAKFEKDWAMLYREKRKFHNTLYWLKQSGLISKDNAHRNSKWSITKEGIGKLSSLTNHKYKTKLSTSPIIVSYDIPEKKRKERAWVREVLQIVGFTMVHQSVWVGNVAIPEEFLRELRQKKLFAFVHIFSIGEMGTLRQLK